MVSVNNNSYNYTITGTSCASTASGASGESCTTATTGQVTATSRTSTYTASSPTGTPSTINTCVPTPSCTTTSMNVAQTTRPIDSMAYDRMTRDAFGKPVYWKDDLPYSDSACTKRKFLDDVSGASGSNCPTPTSPISTTGTVGANSTPTLTINPNSYEIERAKTGDPDYFNGSAFQNIISDIKFMANDISGVVNQVKGWLEHPFPNVSITYKGPSAGIPTTQYNAKFNLTYNIESMTVSKNPYDRYGEITLSPRQADSKMFPGLSGSDYGITIRFKF